MGEGIADRLILGLVLCRSGVHAVQTLAVARKQAQGDLGADLLHGGLIDGAGLRLGVLIGGGGIQGRAVRGVGPDGPDHAGGCQRDATGVVDLTAGGLNGAVQQLLLGGVLAVGGTVADLDLVQAVDHGQRGDHHKKHGGTKADMTQPGTEPCVRVRTAAAGTVLFGIGGWCLHCVLPKKPKKRALPHAFRCLVYFAVLTEARMVIAPSWSRSDHCRTADALRTRTLPSSSRM